MVRGFILAENECEISGDSVVNTRQDVVPSAVGGPDKHDELASIRRGIHKTARFTGRLWRDSAGSGPIRSGGRNRPQETKDLRNEPLSEEARLIQVIEVLPDRSPQGLVQSCMRRIRIWEMWEPYTCLSYVWGKSYDEHFEILIEEPDYHRSGTFSVRRNLNDFLEVARIKHHSISLWIDAICIDQDNNQERNHQVEQMGEIYRNATRVFA